MVPRIIANPIQIDKNQTIIAIPNPVLCRESIKNHCATHPTNGTKLNMAHKKAVESTCLKSLFLHFTIPSAIRKNIE